MLQRSTRAMTAPSMRRPGTNRTHRESRMEPGFTCAISDSSPPTRPERKYPFRQTDCKDKFDRSPIGRAYVDVFYIYSFLARFLSASPPVNVKVVYATHESSSPSRRRSRPAMQREPWEGSGRKMGNSRSMLRAHRTVPACKPECALQGRGTVMTFMIGGVWKSHDR